MKKFFTFICLAVISTMMITPARAQENTLSDYEKAEVVKKMVPIMFDQVKQITGIDFLAPTRADFDLLKVVNSPLFAVPGMTMRADDGKVTATFKPEKIDIDLSSFDLPYIGSLISTATVSFDDYTLITVPYNGRDYEISLPGKVALSLGSVFENAVILTFTTEAGNGFLPFNSLIVDIKYDSTILALLNLAGISLSEGTLITFTETEIDTDRYDYNLVLEKALRDLIALAETTTDVLPDFKVSLDVESINEGIIAASLYGIITGMQQIPMGVADVTIKDDSRVVVLTSYENGVRAGFRKLTESTSVVESMAITTTTDSIRTNRLEPWEWSATNLMTIEQTSLTESALLRASDINLLAIVRKSVNDMINDILVNEYAITNSTVYKLPVTYIEEEGEEDSKVTIIEDFIIPLTITDVIPSISGSPSNPTGLVKIIVSSLDVETLDQLDDFDELSAVAKEELLSLIDAGAFTFEEDLLVNATLAPDKPLLTIDFITPENENPLVTVYVETNTMQIILDTDPIAIDAVNIRVQKEGIVVEGMEKGTYSVVNILGSVVNKGRIDNHSSYISTSALPRGIYVLVLDGDAKEAVKFVK